jgi:hypothetical protein
MELNKRSSKVEESKTQVWTPKNRLLRDEAQLNCVSLRPLLDDEQEWGAVKGQDERCLSAPPLTLHPWRIRDGRKKYEKADTSALTFLTFS